MATGCGFEDGGILVVTTHGRFNNAVDVINSYQLQLVDGGPVTREEWQDDVVAWAEGLLTLVRVFCSALTIWDGVSAEFTQGVCSSGKMGLLPAFVGAVAGDSLPPGNAALVTFPTGVKRVVMRKYFGAIAEASTAGPGSLDPAIVPDIAAAADYLIAPQTINGHIWQYGHLSPKTLEFEVPTSYLTPRTIAYQRRRRPGTGS